jgi:hypothetical protein
MLERCVKLRCSHRRPSLIHSFPIPSPCPPSFLPSFLPSFFPHNPPLPSTPVRHTQQDPNVTNALRLTAGWLNVAREILNVLVGDAARG